VAQEIEITENPVTFHIKVGTWTKIPKAVKSLIKNGEFEVISVASNSSNTANTVFSADAYDCYKGAALQIESYIKRGYKDAIVIAFNEGQRVSVTEAKEKTKAICK